MFIIYDTKEKLIGNYEKFGVRCSRCGKTETISFSIYQKYFRFFWIPFVPLKKIVYENCDYCIYEKKVVKSDPAYSELIYEAKRTTKTRLYFFTGAMLLSVFILFATYTIVSENKLMEKRLTEPKIGDVYEMRDSIASYSYYAKVFNTNKDSVFLEKSSVSFHMLAKKKPVPNAPIYNQGDTIYILKSALLQLFKNNYIQRVHRRKNID